MSDATFADDLAFARQLASGDKAALARFEREIAFEITAAIRKVDRARDFVDELAQ
ncbi:MAG TPA: hypothetical protein VK427_10530 [Kofleriaceae bacterium]|nr:hypothetical protein [Kofleriaceae bacterium]